MSQALRKLTGLLAKTKTTIIFINQIRHKIGVMFGSPETTTGGLALKFYATQRLDIRRIETIKQGELAVGSKVRVKVVKNKVAPPYRTAEFEMVFGKGFSYVGELVDMGLLAGILERSGTWYLYKGDRLGQGRENAKAFLAESPAIAKEIEDALRAKYMNTATSEKEEPAEAEAAAETAKPAKAEKTEKTAKAETVGRR
jgi:recombination protein RecA